jgi:hypothetical protein
MSREALAVLIILRPKDARNERYLILMPQASNMLGLPAGTLSSINTVVLESAGLKIRNDELIELVAPAPAGRSSVASMRVMACEQELDRKRIENLKSLLAGEQPQRGRPNAPRMCPYEALWRSRSIDARALDAWRLYESLSRAGKVEERLADIRMGRSVTVH